MASGCPRPRDRDGDRDRELEPIRVPGTLATGVKGRAIRVTGATRVAITPDGATACLGSGRGEVVPITLATGTKGKAINVGSAVDNLAITPNGKRAYVVP